MLTLKSLNINDIKLSYAEFTKILKNLKELLNHPLNKHYIPRSMFFCNVFGSLRKHLIYVIRLSLFECITQSPPV